MKKKVLATVLLMTLGITVFGMTAEAAEAKIRCSHPNLVVTCFLTSEYANSVYHWTYEVERQYCPACGYESETVSEPSYDEHDFSVYTNDGRYCSDCGCRDEFYY